MGGLCTLYKEGCASLSDSGMRWMHLYSFVFLKAWESTNTFLLTYSMVQSPSSEVNWSEASQEIPRILWNPKVHHCTHKRTPPVLILSQLHPVQTPTSHFSKIHPNIILPSTPGSPQWPPSLGFPHQNPVHTSSLPHTRYMHRPSHSIVPNTDNLRYLQFYISTNLYWL
jgi:hypothetical protein